MNHVLQVLGGLMLVIFTSLFTANYFLERNQVGSSDEISMGNDHNVIYRMGEVEKLCVSKLKSQVSSYNVSVLPRSSIFEDDLFTVFLMHGVLDGNDTKHYLCKAALRDNKIAVLSIDAAVDD